MTNWHYYEAAQRFHRILEARGINAALRQAGAKQGDIVTIGDFEFNFLDHSQKWFMDLLPET
jgi:GTP-binding protein